jgi:hypothetical protein
MRGMTRRECLQRLLLLLAAPVVGCGRKRDPFAEQCVCIHVFEAGDPLPSPLLRAPRVLAELKPAPRDFDVGLPDLMVCSTRIRFLDLFRTFWPFTLARREELRRQAAVAYRVPAVRTADDVARLAAFLRAERGRLAVEGARVAVVFVLHGGNRGLLPGVVRAARGAAADEIVILKDPSVPPYLCDFPSRQLKGW